MGPYIYKLAHIANVSSKYHVVSFVQCITKYKMNDCDHNLDLHLFTCKCIDMY